MLSRYGTYCLKYMATNFLFVNIICYNSRPFLVLLCIDLIRTGTIYSDNNLGVKSNSNFFSDLIDSLCLAQASMNSASFALTTPTTTTGRSS
jgi:hypothetical protein